MNNIKSLRNDMISSLKKYNAPLDNGLILSINNCNSQQELDIICDVKFIEAWMSKKLPLDKYIVNEDFDNGIKSFYIGNGLEGFAYKNNRYMYYDDALEQII